MDLLRLLKELYMTEVKTNKYVAWFTENWFTVFFFLAFALIIGSLFTNVIDHRNDVRAVSKQNAGCIYLESSDLGDGQHYMICDGQIVLKRLADEDAVEPTTEEKLEEVVPTEAKPTTPAK
jgi:DMSO reductase anchor subunit